MGIHKDRPTIGFFAPFVSGHYLSAICAELRKQCTQRKMDLIVIMTNETTEFDMPLALDHIDAAFITVDVVSPAFAAQMLARNIPLVSATEEYFPLEVESVTCHQDTTIELAFEHLYTLGHRKIGFVGSLYITDFRVRYEALLNCYRKKGMVFSDDWLIDVSDPGIAGGGEASDIFLQRKCDCSALICGSDMMAFGLINAMGRKGIVIPEQVALVGIDNNPLGQKCTPTLTSIDQDLPLMVNQVLNRLQARLAGQPFSSKKHLIEPHLVIRQSCGADEALHDLQPENNESTNTASHMQDSSELGLAIGGRGYLWLAGLSNLWGPFFKALYLAQWLKQPDNQNAETPLTLVDIITNDTDNSALDAYRHSQIQPEQFPPIGAALDDADDLAFITLMPICPEGLKWGVLTIIDKLDENMDQAAYNMFFYYASLTSVFMQREALTESIRVREHQALKLAERLDVIAHATNDGVWTWNLDLNLMEWNNGLLEMLDFITKKDKQQYRHMPFLERIHPQDQKYTRNAIREHLLIDKPFKLKFRMQAKSGGYLWVDASGEAIREADRRISRFVGALTNITEQHHSTQRIEFMAYHDSLTKLPNRVAFVERVEAHMAQQVDACFAVMLMDLNRFKQVNDNFGHSAGDAVLIHVAQQISKVLRKHDHVSRFGGDEFVFHIPAATGKEALSLAQRILSEVQGTMFYDGDEIPVEGCLGISLYPAHGQTLEALVHKADIAMYHAKYQQYDKAQIYHSELEPS